MSAKPLLVLGLDSGTQSTKACVWDLQGHCLARSARPLTVGTPREGWAEQDPAQWWESTRGAIAEAASRVDASRIGAVGVAFQRETFTLVDDPGAAVRPGMLWLDIRAAEEVEEVSRRLGAGAFRRRTGKPLDVTSVIPRMLWIARHEPGTLEGARRWTDVGAFLLERLTGIPSTCVAGADTTGLVDLATRWWAPDLLSAAGLDAMRMPGLVEPGSIAGSLSAEAAAATGLRRGLPVVAAGGDGQVLAVGLGVAAGGGYTLTLGTSIVLGLPRAASSVSSLYRTLISARPDRQYLLESVIQSGTYILQWFGRNFGAGADPAGEAELERMVSEVPAGSDGLVTVPHWWGVRFPESLPDARGATAGWSHRHTRSHFLRSILEGTAFELKKLAEDYLVEIPGSAAPRITVGGGGTQSRAWRRILCDSLALPLVVNEEPEPVALGAALLAAVSVGAFPDVDAAGAAMIRAGEALTPEPDAAGVYQSIFRGSYLPLREAALRFSSGGTP